MSGFLTNFDTYWFFWTQIYFVQFLTGVLFMRIANRQNWKLWYDEYKSKWSPPGAVFGIVWMGIYVSEVFGMSYFMDDLSKAQLSSDNLRQQWDAAFILAGGSWAFVAIFVLTFFNFSKRHPETKIITSHLLQD